MPLQNICLFFHCRGKLIENKLEKLEGFVTSHWADLITFCSIFLGKVKAIYSQIQFGPFKTTPIMMRLTIKTLLEVQNPFKRRSQEEVFHWVKRFLLKVNLQCLFMMQKMTSQIFSMIFLQNHCILAFQKLVIVQLKEES